MSSIKPFKNKVVGNIMNSSKLNTIKIKKKYLNQKLSYILIKKI